MEPAEDYEYNNLKEIESLRHELITDKTLTQHDALFKIIIIGDTGRRFLNSFQVLANHAS